MNEHKIPAPIPTAEEREEIIDFYGNDEHAYERALLEHRIAIGRIEVLPELQDEPDQSGLY